MRNWNKGQKLFYEINNINGLQLLQVPYKTEDLPL